MLSTNMPRGGMGSQNSALSQSAQSKSAQRNNSMCRDSDVGQLIAGLDSLLGEIQSQLCGIQSPTKDPDRCNEALEVMDLNQCINTVAGAAISSDLEREYQIEQRLVKVPSIKAQPRALYYVVFTLLKCAAELVNPLGEILIATYVDGNEIVLGVASTGQEIPVSEIPGFFSVSNPIRSLACVGEIVADHGGTIVAKEISDGATFELRLPLS